MTPCERRLTREDERFITQHRPILASAWQVVNGPNNVWSVLFFFPPKAQENYGGCRRIYWIALQLKRLYVPEKRNYKILPTSQKLGSAGKTIDKAQRDLDVKLLDCNIQHYKSVTLIFFTFSLAYFSLGSYLSTGSDNEETLLKKMNVCLLILNVVAHFYCRHQIYLCSDKILSEGQD